MPISLWQLTRGCLVPTAMTGILALAGCGTSLQEVAASPAYAGRVITGHVHGGVNPIQNATIRLMETQSNGYGGAAKQLTPTTTSDVNGYFTFPDTGWTCDSGQFAYITVSSGHSSNVPGTAVNDNVVQVGVIGSCADLATTADIDAVNLFVSELSTVAAAYALGNFITIDNTNASTGEQIVNISAPPNNSSTAACTGLGTNMICTAAGLAHAFANAYDLVDSVRFDGSFPVGTARSTNPNNPVSIVPQQVINTIGDILQDCVDSSPGGIAGDGSYCGNLFLNAAPPTGSGVAAPTNTLQAAMDMAKFPTNNVTGLFNLQSRFEPFTPVLSSAPTSFTVSLFYGATASGSYVPFPVDLALDASDEVYVLYGASGTASTASTTGTANTYGAIFALNANGSQAFRGAPNTSILYPSQIAIASTGRVYVTNNDTTTPANGGVYQTAGGSSNGTLSLAASLNNASGVAIDAGNNVWVSAANTTGNSISEFAKATIEASSGSISPTTYSSVLALPVSGLAVDANQNIWGVSGATSGNASAVMLPNTGTARSASYASAGTGGISTALSTYDGFGVAINASGAAYFPDYQNLDSATYASSAITLSSTSVATAGSNVPHRAEVDGAGNVFWMDNESTGQLFSYNPTTSALISLLPCFPYPNGSSYVCITTSNSNSAYTPSNLRAMAIDSAGDVWYAADAGYGTVIETLGLAAPTWPLLAYPSPGSMPQ